MSCRDAFRVATEARRATVGRSVATPRSRSAARRAALATTNRGVCVADEPEESAPHGGVHDSAAWEPFWLSSRRRSESGSRSRLSVVPVWQYLFRKLCSRPPLTHEGSLDERREDCHSQLVFTPDERVEDFVQSGQHFHRQRASLHHFQHRMLGNRFATD
eukprot:Selendium_serpulae@DN6360_c0_g1_i1.p2